MQYIGYEQTNGPLMFQSMEKDQAINRVWAKLAVDTSLATTIAIVRFRSVAASK